MLKNRKRILWSALVIVVLTLSGLAFVTERPKPTKLTAETKLPTTAQAVPTFRPRLRVYVHRDSVRPSVIHAWPGKTLISIENESGADIALQIEKTLVQQMLPIALLKLPSHAKRAEQEVTLGIGEYVLYDLSRPNVRSRLIVEVR